MEDIHYIIAVAAGFVAGIINTLAGSGSLFTLPVLLFLGLPAHDANGTNRVGILLQTLVGATTLYRKGNVTTVSDLRFILPAMAGSVTGALIAVEIPESVLKLTIGIVMLFLLITLLFNYNSMMKETDVPVSGKKQNISMVLMFFIGVYGGFIQMGVGIFLLSALLLYLQFTFRHANALKNSINFFLTIPAFIVFAVNGQVQWEIGVVMASGQMVGAWLAARFASENQKANLWIRRLLIVMTLFSALKLLDVF